MTKIVLAATALLIAWALQPTVGHAQTAALAPMPEQQQDRAKGTDPASCRIPVQVTEAAERQPGGALHEGSMAGQRMMAQSPATAKMPKMAEMSAQMSAQMSAKMSSGMAKVEGAHMIHRGQYGGAFFMAPNKLNHLEIFYSDDCGFRVIFYNIRTESIRAARFRTFIKVVPDSMDEPEVLRFLSPGQNGDILSASIGEEAGKPFEIQLYVEFLEGDEPELFTIRVP